MLHAVRSGFVRYFDFSGRSTRSEFWYFMLGWILLYLIVAAIDQAAMGPVLNLSDLPFYEFIPYSYVDQQVGWLTFLYRPLTAIPTIAVTVRRLHDAGNGLVLRALDIAITSDRLVLVIPATHEAWP